MNFRYFHLHWALPSPYLLLAPSFQQVSLFMSGVCACVRVWVHACMRTCVHVCMHVCVPLSLISVAHMSKGGRHYCSNPLWGALWAHSLDDEMLADSLCASFGQVPKLQWVYECINSIMSRRRFVETDLLALPFFSFPLPLSSLSLDMDDAMSHLRAEHSTVT